MTLVRRFCLFGAPRTKKNHSRVVRAGKRLRIVPSNAHQRWFKSAFPQASEIARRAIPIRYPVNVAATFFRDRAIGDAVGYYQALGDLLERAGIVENDCLIVSWNGSLLAKDAKRPRIEIEISEVAT